MRQALAGNPVPAAIFALTLVVWLVSEARQALRQRSDAANSDRYSLTVVRLSVSAGVVLAALAQRVSATAFAYSAVVFVISLALLWAGIGLRWWCFRTLGRYFTFVVMTSGEQPVISTGPYAVVRHPSYAGMLLALCGLSLSFANWLSVVALLVCALLGFIHRIHVEERALTAALGPAYTSHAGTRRRLIPFVW